jgi:hypothetical protein
MKITIFRNIWELETPYYLDAKSCLDRIKNGNSKAIIQEIRSNKEQKNEIKKKLPSILFSGEFPNRKKGAIPLQHSGLIVLDIDGLNEMELSSTKSDICGDKFTYACFVSPSNNGLKVLIKIPKDIKRHAAYFIGLEKYYSESLLIKVDASGKNIGRVCYESYDPDIYINDDSEVFKSYIDEIPDSKKKDTSNSVISIKSSNEIIERVAKWWKKNYRFLDGRNQAIYQLAAALNRYGISKSETLDYCLQYTDNSKEGDPFDATEITGVVDKVYKNLIHMHNTEFFEDSKKIKSIQDEIMGMDIENAVSSIQNYDEFSDFTPVEVEEFVENIKAEPKKKITTKGRVFWYYDDGKLKINIEDLFQFINDSGFYVYYPNETPDNYKFIKIENNILRAVDTREIKATVLDFVLTKKQNIVYNLLNERTKYWTDKFLNILPTIKPHILRDTKKTAYIPTPSGVYKITKSHIQKIDYVDLTEGYVWNTQITARDFKFIGQKEAFDGDFSKFVNNVAGQDFSEIKTTIGYLLHTYKDPAKSKAVFFYDKNITQIDGEAEGGSGKSLIIEGLKKIREIASIPGDRIDFTRTFVFQEINESTQLAWIDEMDMNTDIHKFFSRITGGIPVEKKRKDVVFIENDKSPKFVFTSNFKPKGTAGSYKRRKVEFAVTDHYNATHTPLNEFKHSFFTEWDAKEWDLFFTFYLECLRYYLENGIIEQNNENTDYLTCLVEFGQDFTDYWYKDERLNNAIADGFFIGRQVYKHFILIYDLFESDFSIKKFYSYTKKILNLHNINFEIEGQRENLKYKLSRKYGNTNQK